MKMKTATALILPLVALLVATPQPLHAQQVDGDGFRFTITVVDDTTGGDEVSQELTVGMDVTSEDGFDPNDDRSPPPTPSAPEGSVAPFSANIGAISANGNQTYFTDVRAFKTDATLFYLIEFEPENVNGEIIGDPVEIRFDAEVATRIDEAFGNVTFTDGSGNEVLDLSEDEDGVFVPRENLSTNPGGGLDDLFLSVDVRSDVIPVELTSFTAATQGSDVVLNWETATEENNEGFEVQTRRAEATESVWQEAAFVKGAGDGTTTEPQRYQHTIEGLAPGAHVFRLVQIDRDGTRHVQAQQVEATVSVDNYDLSAASPNPFQTQARMQLTVATPQDVTVEAYDILGRRVATLHEGPVDANAPVELIFDSTGLASGQYFVRATGETFADTRSVVLVK